MPRGKDLDLFHQRFGKWTVLEKGDLSPGSGIFWKCQCDCGEIRLVKGSALYLGESKGCGCDRTKTHGMSKTRTFKSWDSMKQRCLNQNSPDYSRYGGRGITVCERWLNSFEWFLEDLGERPEGRTLDRIDPDGNYEPGNCRWATASEQQFNRRFNKKLEYRGQVKPMVDLSSESGVPLKILRWRLENGWNIDRAIETPVRVKSRSSIQIER